MLDLHAAALVAVLDQAASGTVQVPIGMVLSELLRHEQHLWYRSAYANGLRAGPNGLSDRQARQVIAVGCLLGAASEQDARELAGRVPGLAPSGRVAQWLRQLYPPDSGEPDWLGSLQPDSLAELHTIRELAGSRELAHACLTGLDARQARRALTVLARASAGNAEAEDLLGQILPDTADVDAPLETLIAIFNAIPYPTGILAPAAAALAQRIMGMLPSDSEPEIRAYRLSVLGIRFSALGRPADALPAVEEAITIHRQLAAADPDRHRPDLAAALTALAEVLTALDRHVDSDAARAESAELRSRPDR